MNQFSNKEFPAFLVLRNAFLSTLKVKLEIWSRAQRAAARRCKPDWGDNLGKGVKIPLAAKSRFPNAVTSAYSTQQRRRFLLNSGGTTWRARSASL